MHHMNAIQQIEVIQKIKAMDAQITTSMPNVTMITTSMPDVNTPQLDPNQSAPEQMFQQEIDLCLRSTVSEPVYTQSYQ